MSNYFIHIKNVLKLPGCPESPGIQGAELQGLNTGISPQGPICPLSWVGPKWNCCQCHSLPSEALSQL